MVSAHQLTIIIAIAVISIAFSLYRISIEEKELTKNILRLNIENERYTGIEEEIRHLDEILTASVYMYIYSGSEEWKSKYDEKHQRLTFLLNSQLRFTADDSIRHYLKELTMADIRLIGLESEAIRLTQRNQEAALAALNSPVYLEYKDQYDQRVKAVSGYINRVKERNNQFIASWLRSNQVMYNVILFLNLLAWATLVVLFNRSSRLATRRNKELKHVNTALQKSLDLERVGAEQGDINAVIHKYLKFLKEHLPYDAFYYLETQKEDVRVRSAISNGQVLKGDANMGTRFRSLQAREAIEQVLNTNESLGMSNGQTIKTKSFAKARKSLEGIFTPITTENGSNALLYVDPGGKVINESDIGILHTISNQFRISLQNAQIYSGLEEKIQQRTHQLKQLNATLREKEQRLIYAQQIAHLGSWEYAASTGEVSISNELQTILELPEGKETYAWQYFTRFIREEEKERIHKFFTNPEAGGQAATLELKVSLANDKYKYLVLQMQPKRRGRKVVSMIGTLQDITERKKIELAYKESRERFLNVFENTQTGVVASDKRNRYTMINTQFSNMVGYSKQELTGMTIYDLLQLDGKEEYEESMNQLIDGSQQSFTMQLKYKTKDGRKITTLTRQFGVYGPEGKFVESVASILDITDQVEASKKIMESIIETENLERTRIATTLHDSIGQNLTSLHLMLTSLAQSKNLDEQDKNNVGKVIDITRRTITETRQISHNLMPKYITRFGLIASVENLVQDLNTTSIGTVFSVYHNFKDELLSISEQIAIYRIIQESVNNILKYAKAKEAYIQLVQHANIVTVLIEDDGAGFDQEKVDKSKSLGLKSLQNRAQSISAELEIDSKVGRGTTISVQLTV